MPMGEIITEASHQRSLTAHSLLDKRADRLLQVCTASPSSMRRGIRVMTCPALAALCQPACIRMRAGHVRACTNIQTQNPGLALVTRLCGLAWA